MVSVKGAILCVALHVFLSTFCSGAPVQQSAVAVAAKVPTAKIVNGHDVVRRRSYHPHPYLVSIQFKNGNNQYLHTCGGAILDRYTIITAAHCFDEEYKPDCWGRDPECYRVVAGMYNLAEFDPEHMQASMFSSDAIEDHENFDGFHYDNDVALIQLESPLNYSSFVKPIRLVNPHREYKKTNATIAGWGRSDKNEASQYVSEVLQEARVTIYTDEQCIHQWGDDYHPENMICAAGEVEGPHMGTGDACQGDSGGPLVAKDIHRKRRYLVGLISWGYDCGIKEYPGLYTRLETFLPWIKEKRHDMKIKRHRSVRSCDSN